MRQFRFHCGKPIYTYMYDEYNTSSEYVDGSGYTYMAYSYTITQLTHILVSVDTQAGII